MRILLQNEYKGLEIYLLQFSWLCMRQHAQDLLKCSLSLYSSRCQAVRGSEPHRGWAPDRVSRTPTSANRRRLTSPECRSSARMSNSPSGSGMTGTGLPLRSSSHVDFVDVWPLLSINFYVDKLFVHDGGHLLALKALSAPSHDTYSHKSRALPEVNESCRVGGHMKRLSITAALASCSLKAMRGCHTHQWQVE